MRNLLTVIRIFTPLLFSSCGKGETGSGVMANSFKSVNNSVSTINDDHVDVSFDTKEKSINLNWPCNLNFLHTYNTINNEN